VLLAPEALPAGRHARPDAVLAGWLDARPGRHFPRAHHEHGTWRHSHYAFRDGAEKHAREASPTVRSDDHEVCLELARDQGDLVRRRADAHVKDDALRQGRRRIGQGHEASDAAIHVPFELELEIAGGRDGRHRLRSVLEPGERREGGRGVHGMNFRVGRATRYFERVHERAVARVGVVHPHDDDLGSIRGCHGFLTRRLRANA
jgi:hypothetical protein